VSTVTEQLDRMRVAGGAGDRPKTPDREQVQTLAAQFESMLLVQMLRDMRRSGKWEDESPESGGLGAETYFETLDVELANYLSRAKGLGLGQELLTSLEKTAGLQKTAPAAAAPVAATPVLPAAPELSSSNRAMAPTGTEAPLRFAVAPGSITSAFGWRRDPFSGQSKFHRGIDVRATYGQDIQAAGEGRVVFSGSQGGYGTTVLVEHGNGVQTRYAHLSATVVQAGDRVGAGQVLGRAGQSGRATGTHLHFEVTRNGHPVSPAEAGLSAGRADKTGDIQAALPVVD
jgi:murein DD-endopeptidase MepM/ murein hydrolase activator NlpD